MAGENDAVAYDYINVALPVRDTRDAIAYDYINFISRGARSFIGGVLGFAGAPRLGIAYVFANLGFDVTPSPDAIVMSMWNQLEYTSGAARTLEDGSPRTLEDGTQRTVE